jgi:uncharacterized protein YuzE
MKIKYFQDTDTLYIEFKRDGITRTEDLDENTVMDFDSQGNICAITMEHAKNRAEFPAFSFEQVAVAA